MYSFTRIIAGSLVGAAMIVAPAVAVASPAFASSKENVMTAASEHDAANRLADAHHAAEIGTAHAQNDVLRIDHTGHMTFKDDGGHTMSFDRPVTATAAAHAH
jgi:hypothetical protein